MCSLLSTLFVVSAVLFQESCQASIKVDPATLPTFLTSSQMFKVTEKDTVILPCEVSNPGPYVLAWKKGIAVLSAGNVKVSPDPRISLVDGYSLEIKEVTPQDGGDYVCQIGTLEPREITHTVEILVPPRINYVSSNGRVEVKKGSSVRLECRANGNPPPKITWSRKNNVLPSGDQTLVTPVLTLDKVDRHQAGVYKCTASNGVGQDVTQDINLHVLYPPEISVEKPLVHSGEGQEAQLVCIVHGENQPEVLWYRDTMQLDTTERRIMESRGSRHTLLIRKVHRSDFGNYTCVADNQLGKTRKSVQLTGKPNPAKFNSATRGNWRDSYNISWAVESYSPIEEYKLLFRELPDNPGSDDGHPQPLHHQSQRKFNPGRENRTHGAVYYNVGNGYGRQIIDRRADWRNVILPATTAASSGFQSMSYVIRGLVPGQSYEAKVQARNKFGWSPVSEAFTFQTTDTELTFPERPQTPRHVFEENDLNGFGIRIYRSSASLLSTEAVIVCVAFRFFGFFN
ncbi:limbic system-associated membrane protein isoform X1 [Tribolium castaneum]|uniref:Protein amalgam-like Protein n=1 Tax=Tribolium castaneum TaxID=7070 RepID=A0A139WLL5_TRICA|nr:PREDICTED: limbic system-associated membrane protein isoform X1 [Tribolium castaneum]XP_015833361.1 PREDICTED: limbic system-associated membrane protein isoform X1 [Tribolium castaneum]KYB28717.1 Protein amalgam-like Protein [Tribolium castaneum]|eukprot:XP_008191833.1 PREDICTED: limbic system-associated membrane protein isoform X1 [Tribolium castaneum]